MPKKTKPKTTSKQALLDALAKLPRMKAIGSRFRPGRGAAAIRKALPDELEDVDELALLLVKQLFAHEPWDSLKHHLLEPLFDATRLLGTFPHDHRISNIPEATVCVRRGPVRVKGDLAIRGVLLVAGDLHVNGTLLPLGEEWYSGTLVVTGNVYATRASILGPVAIGGTFALKQGLMTAYFHDTSSTLTARRIEAPIWFDRGDIDRRVVGTKAIPHRLRFQKWIDQELGDYFEEQNRKVDWDDFDAAFYRKAVRAASRR